MFRLPLCLVLIRSHISTQKNTDNHRLALQYGCNYVSRQNAMIHLIMLPQRAGLDLAFDVYTQCERYDSF